MTWRSDLARTTVLGAGFGTPSMPRELRRRDRAARITWLAPRPRCTSSSPNHPFAQPPLES